jgi:hypothetical protein
MGDRPRQRERQEEPSGADELPLAAVLAEVLAVGVAKVLELRQFCVVGDLTILRARRLRRQRAADPRAVVAPAPR